MAQKLVLSRKKIESIAQSESVKAALNRQARLILPRAERLAAQGGRVRLAKALRVEAGTRVGAKAEGGFKRPYARVVADYPEADRKADARARVTTRAVMRRSAGG